VELTVWEPLGVQRPLSVVITAGQGADSPRFEAVLEAVGVPSPGLGGPCMRRCQRFMSKAPRDDPGGPLACVHSAGFEPATF
jgi:hypothetical protein